MAVKHVSILEYNINTLYHAGDRSKEIEKTRSLVHSKQSCNHFSVIAKLCTRETCAGSVTTNKNSEHGGYRYVNWLTLLRVLDTKY